jgi:hypothetical protein
MANAEQNRTEALLRQHQESNMSADTSTYGGPERSQEKKRSKFRTFGKRALIAAAIVTPFALFGTGVANGLAHHVEPHSTIVKEGSN